eukprot:tig00020592_g11691.t1
MLSIECGRDAELDAIFAALEALQPQPSPARPAIASAGSSEGGVGGLEGRLGPRPEAAASAPEAPDADRATAYVLLGDSGSGKSALAREAVAAAEALGVRAAEARAIPGEGHALALWRQMLAALFPSGMLEVGALSACACTGEDHRIDEATLEDLRDLLPAPAAPALAAAAVLAAGAPPAVVRRRSSLKWVSAGPDPAAPLATAPPAPAPAPDGLTPIGVPGGEGLAATISGAVAYPSPVTSPTDGQQRPNPASASAAAKAKAGKEQRRQLPPDVRAASLRAAIVRLVLARASGGGRPLLLVFEDVHNADSQSLRALLELAAQLREARGEARALLLISCRPPGSTGEAGRGGAGAFLEKIASSRGHRLLDLAPLGPQDVALLARAHLDASSIPQAAAAFIGESKDALRTALTSRVDKLSPGQLFSIKVASVLGQRFAVGDVLAVHPGDGVAAGQLEGDYEALCAAGLLREVISEAAAGPAYEGVAAPGPLVDVVYSLLPVAERRRLHRTYAVHVEARERERIRALLVERGETPAPGSESMSLAACAPTCPAPPPAPRLAPSEGSSEALLDAATLDLLARHWLAADDLAAVRRAVPPAATPHPVFFFPGSSRPAA